MSTPLAAVSGVGLFFAIMIVTMALGVGLFVIVAFSNRAEADGSGSRPMAVYLFTGAFFTLWLAITGALTIIVSLVGLIGTNYAFSYSEVHPVGDAAARGVTLGAILLILAGLAHVLHRSRGLSLAEAEADPSGPTRRAARSYAAAVSFSTIFVGLASAAALIYSVFQLIAPGVYDAGARDTTWKVLIVEICLVAISAVAFVRDQRLAPPALRLFSRRPGPPRPTVESMGEAPATE